MGKYQILIKPEAEKDLTKLTPKVQARILDSLDEMRDGLVGDVKKLKNYSPRYRKRIGDYRILFNIEDESIVVYNILPRGDAYQRKG